MSEEPLYSKGHVQVPLYSKGHVQPSTLNPQPSTLNPTPYTPHPTPYTPTFSSSLLLSSLELRDTKVYEP